MEHSCGARGQGHIIWQITGDTLVLSGTGEMLDFGAWEDPAPWYSNFTKVVVGEGITSIGNYAFALAKNMTEIILPSTLRTIGKHAFENCVTLESIRLPAGISEITSSVFKGCVSLRTVELPTRLERIWRWAFQNCTVLRQLHLPGSVSVISSTAFWGVDLDVLGLIEPGRFAVKAHCLYDCLSRRVIMGNDIEHIELPTDAESIEEYAFYRHQRVKSITINDNVNNIGRYAFAECPNLEEILISKPIGSVGAQALYGTVNAKVVWRTSSRDEPLAFSPHIAKSARQRHEVITCTRHGAVAVYRGRVLAENNAGFRGECLPCDLSSILFQDTIRQLASEMDICLATNSRGSLTICPPSVESGKKKDTMRDTMHDMLVNSIVFHEPHRPSLSAPPSRHSPVVSISATEAYYAVVYGDGSVYSNMSRYRSTWQDWREIVQTAITFEDLIGLDGHGDIHITPTSYKGITGLTAWHDVVQIDATGCYYCNPRVAGLCSDGKILYNCDRIDVSSLHDIVQVSAGNYYVIAVDTFGTVWFCTDDGCFRLPWQDVIAVRAGIDCAFGLTADGKLLQVSAGDFTKAAKGV